MFTYFKRSSIFFYGLISYLIFLATFVYSIGFIANLPFAPRTLDGEPRLPFWIALGIDVALLAIFSVQHSLMARPAFKAWWTQWIPPAAERSTYVLFSSLALILLYSYWQPLGGEIWNIENRSGRLVMGAIFGFGWALVLYATLLINHFDLFGLRQVWLNLLGKPYTELEFKTPGAYKLVRHPLYLGWFLCFWATPTMSAAHLLFAVLTSIYILAAIQLEERDLLRAHPEYADYRRQVPMLLPRMGGRDKAEHDREAA
ncbi:MULTISPECIES: methanethiol S-methyltransferase [Pseudomonas]|uniref:methanethiol S-methyltransferase n=1 Tax=Pseudomonadaceae TaxID=135621 RepID=UPI00042635B9|nr:MULTISPECIES: methanethiol S-methyltransferase [Pseudomonas]MDE3736656.1 methyltransferase [Pseudomonas resinovorans]